MIQGYLRKEEKRAGRDTKGGARETSLPSVAGETSLGRYEWQPGEITHSLRKAERLADCDTKGGTGETSVPTVRRGSLPVGIRMVGREK